MLNLKRLLNPSHNLVMNPVTRQIHNLNLNLNLNLNHNPSQIHTKYQARSQTRWK